MNRPEKILKAAAFVSMLAFAALLRAQSPLHLTEANYDESKAGTFTLPDPLLLANGATVQDSNDWTDNRRPQILKLYEGYIYGSSPKWRNMIDKVWDADANAFGGKALRKQINLEFYNYNHAGNNNPTNNLVFHVLLYTPAAATNRVPVFLCLSFSPNYSAVNDTNVAVYPVWNHKTDTLEMPTNIQRGLSKIWPIEKIIGRGYGIALVDYNDIEPDLPDGSGILHGVRSLYFKPGQTNTDADEWGAISAWAWGASRVMDYLEIDRAVDAHRVIMVGHSRLGKTALWAGAEDPRFAMVIASCSGEMGAALARRDHGETVTSMCKNFPYQFCPNFLDYSNNIGDLPVDSHMLISLIAPRPLFLNTGSEDRWSDPRGEFEAAIAAAPVYRLFGKESVATNLPPDVSTNGSGSLLKSSVLETYKMPPPDAPVMRDVGFQIHRGGHDVLPEDWDDFLDFADLHFYGKQPVQ
ncbi:MAG TPA: acetylxylan esterase [Methylomirabilota bacterium]|nr:acetylxylan esterase [Methylomirabilota bacterium]